MSRRKKKKRQPGIPNPMATVTPLRQPEQDVVQKVPMGKFRYAQAMPHELSGLAPLIMDFFKDVNYEKAMNDPRPVINQMYQEMSKSPYSIVYVCVDEDIKPQGYCWFRVDRNVWNEAFITIEHDYVVPERRTKFSGGKIHDEFIRYIIEIGERCGAKYVNTSVKSKKLEASRMKLGFKPVELKMTFEGTAADFRNKNPHFQEFGRYENDEQEVDNDGRWRGTDKASTGE